MDRQLQPLPQTWDGETPRSLRTGRGLQWCIVVGALRGRSAAKSSLHFLFFHLAGGTSVIILVFQLLLTNNREWWCERRASLALPATYKLKCYFNGLVAAAMANYH